MKVIVEQSVTETVGTKSMLIYYLKAQVISNYDSSIKRSVGPQIYAVENRAFV
jgi:hypothetical protein